MLRQKFQGIKEFPHTPPLTVSLLSTSYIDYLFKSYEPILIKQQQLEPKLHSDFLSFYCMFSSVPEFHPGCHVTCGCHASLDGS